MMRSIALVVVVLLLSGCAGLHKGKWKRRDEILLTGYFLGAVGDAATTIKAKNTEGVEEANPWIDWMKQPNEIIIMGQLASVGVVWVVAEWLPNNWVRTTWLGTTFGIKLITVGNNIVVIHDAGGY